MNQNKSINSKLRYLMIQYGEKIEFPNFYEIYRDRVLKVKSITELTQEKKEELVDIFSMGIKSIEMGMSSIQSENISILKEITGNK